ncbi:MAG: HlyD family efflux transporter periplasmic adaptor subunit, partial [Deltaproteobacteria bacterium]|nr:HlyD family efflux transporter periplasmic adaptor subunit [Deltaproteobacteria bacterium]
MTSTGEPPRSLLRAEREIHPRPWIRWASTVVGGGMLAFALILVAAPWRQFVPGSGKLVAYSPTDREQRIDAPVAGRVVRWFVVEGSIVAAGDPIAELSDVDPEYVARLETRLVAEGEKLTAAEARSEAYGAQERAYDEARTLKVKAAKIKVTMADQKIAAAGQKLAAAKAELETARVNLARQKGLAEKGLTAQRALELAELAVQQAAASVNLREAELGEEKAHRTALEADVLHADAEGLAKAQSATAEVRKANADEAAARGAVAQMQTEISRQASRRVTAPRDGAIFRIAGSQGGELVAAGELLALLVPDTKSRAVELWVDGNDLPLVGEGRHVRVQFEGWPAVQFVGWPSVAVGTFGGTVAMIDSTTSASGRFRVLVLPDAGADPWPDTRYLRQGVRAQGWILLDQVRVGWELWRRLNGFPQSLGSAP